MFRQSTVDRLSSPEELDALMHVTSPRTWLALAALLCLLVAGIIWSAFTTMTTTAPAEGTLVARPGAFHDLGAVAFAGRDDAKEIRPTMQARVEVQIGLGEAPIGVLGKVTAVGTSGESLQEMRHVLGDTTYAQDLVEHGRVIPVHLDFTGPANSSASPTRLERRLLIHAIITLDKQSLLRLVIP